MYIYIYVHVYIHMLEMSAPFPQHYASRFIIHSSSGFTRSFEGLEVSLGVLRRSLGGALGSLGSKGIPWGGH